MFTANMRLGFVLLVALFIYTCEAGSIAWTEKKLGDSCYSIENGAVTKCKVTKGSNADFKGKFDIKGDVQSLSITLKWTNCANALTDAPICLNNGQLEIGCSSKSKIPTGTYPLIPKQITVPNAITNAKVLSAIVDVTFADGSSRKDYLVGSLEALLS